MEKKVRVAVFFGGKSGEHDVSLQSAASVIEALDPTKFDVVPVLIDKEGRWKTGNQALPALENKVEAKRLESIRERVPASLSTYVEGFRSLPSLRFDEVDVVFPVLHGTYGEDGTVQGLLEIADIPYVGAGVMASAVGMDKVMMKKVFAQEGLPQGKFDSVLRHHLEADIDSVVKQIEAGFDYPVFVKPANLGSSVGISKARQAEELKEALRLAAQYDRKVIVEEFIDAREVEVAVLGNEEPEASVPGEIVSSNDFYDYKAKYIDGKSVMQIPAELPDEKREAIRQLALRAYRAIDCTGLARVDFFVKKADGSVLVNEINTMPGFTPYSMYANLWKHSGLSYSDLVNRLVELALDRYQDKKKTRTTFEVE
jgi:D-alanine-D-alanine ligase